MTYQDLFSRIKYFSMPSVSILNGALTFTTLLIASADDKLMVYFYSDWCQICLVSVK